MGGGTVTQMELKKGMVFRNLEGTKCVIANTFMEGERQVVTYKYYIQHQKRWVFKTKFSDLFLRAFNRGWKWE